jgi:type IV pilus assembly protein PilW
MSARGFTLLEVMVGAAISLLVIGLVMLTFLGQQRAFQAVDLTRVAGRTERDALLEMEGSLRRAGWGIDPRYAFDFNSYACAATPCRDSATGPDEMVFVARNPNYRWLDNGVGTCATAGGCYSGNAWGIQSATATSVTLITTNAGDQFHKGRIVLGVCPNGASATMGTITTTVTTAAAVPAQTLQLQPSAADPYHANGFSGNGCFTQPGATLFLVDRFRYAVRAYNNVPWLVLDTGLDLNLDGVLDVNDFTPIADGVEDMQIAYALNVGTKFGFAAPDNNANWVVGDTAGVVEEPNPAAAAPTYSSSTSAPERFNLHPANIRAVRVTLGLRSINQDPSQPGSWNGDHLLLSENRNVPANATAATDKLRRFHTATSVYARDMESRSNFIF